MGSNYQWPVLNELHIKLTQSCHGSDCLPESKDKFAPTVVWLKDRVRDEYGKDLVLDVENYVYGKEKPGLLPQLLQAFHTFFTVCDEVQANAESAYKSSSQPLQRTWLDPPAERSTNDTVKESLQVVKVLCQRELEYGDPFPGTKEAYMALRQMHLSFASLRASIEKISVQQKDPTSLLGALRNKEPNDLKRDLSKYESQSVEPWRQVMKERFMLETELEKRRLENASFNKEWAFSWWAEGFNPVWMKPSQRSEPLAFDMAYTNLWKDQEKKMSQVTRNKLLGDGGPIAFIKNVAKAEIKNGEVTFPHQVTDLEYHTNFVVEAYKKTWAGKSERAHEFARLFRYAACQRSVCKLLIDKWNGEEKQEQQLREWESFYNSYCTTMGRIGEIRLRVEEIEASFERLERILRQLESATKDIHANLMAGEPATLQEDFELLRQGFSKLDQWVKELDRCAVQRDKSVSGETTLSNYYPDAGTSAPTNGVCLYGVSKFNLGAQHDFQLQGSWEGQLSPNFRSSPHADILETNCQWLSVPASSLGGYESETESGMGLEPDHHKLVKWDRHVSFGQKFDGRPTIECWISSLRIERGGPFAFNAYVENVTHRNAILACFAGEQVRATGFGVFYIAYDDDEDQSQIFTHSVVCPTKGDFGDSDIRHLNMPMPGVYVEFPPGRFDEPPQVGVFLQGVELVSGKSVALTLLKDHITRDGVWISAHTPPLTECRMGNTRVLVIAVA